MQLIGWGVQKILGVKVVCENLESLELHQPCVYVGNHQSALDVVSYGAIFPRYASAVAKSDVGSVPLLGWWYKAIGGSLINRNDRELAIRQIKALAEKMKNGKFCAAMMPEGTRNREGRGLLPFKKGPFHLAILAQVPIVAVVSSPLAQIANFKYRVLRPGTIYMRVLPPVFTKGMSEADVDSLMTDVREKMLAALHDLEKYPVSVKS